MGVVVVDVVVVVAPVVDVVVVIRLLIDDLKTGMVRASCTEEMMKVRG